MSFFRYLCLFALSGVQHILFRIGFLHCAFPMLPISLDCQYLIAPSVFSRVIYIYICIYPFPALSS